MFELFYSINILVSFLINMREKRFFHSFSKLLSYIHIIARFSDVSSDAKRAGPMQIKERRLSRHSAKHEIPGASHKSVVHSEGSALSFFFLFLFLSLFIQSRINNSINSTFSQMSVRDTRE